MLIITECQSEIYNLGQVKSGHVLFIPANIQMFYVAA